jgi:glutamate/tyrosine decarboxylase-like PLP-dependent enzyme
MYVTEGIDGSRSGQPIAEAFTILMYYGKNRYIEEAQKIFNTRKVLVEGLKQLDGIRVMYNPQHAVVGIQARGTSNLPVIAEQFQKLGWAVNALPAEYGIAFHFCITSVHANEPEFIPSFINDISIAINYAKSNPEAKASGMVKAYGQLSTQFAPNYVKNIIGDFFCKIRTMPDEIPGFSITDKPRL